MVNTPNNIPRNYNAASKKAQDNVDLCSSLLFDNHQSIKIFITGDIFTQHVPPNGNSYDQNFFSGEKRLLKEACNALFYEHFVKPINSKSQSCVERHYFVVLAA